MVPILDWIFEGIVGWVASIISQLFDAVSGLFLEALGTDMTAMEEYFPFVEKAYDVMQVTAYAILILIVIWQLFRAFGGPITEAENPWHLVVRGALFAFLIGNAKPIFATCLTIARAPYTSLMELSMSGEDFTFAGVEQVLTNGLTTIISAASVVGMVLIIILLIALGWNYFKLLLETVERYIVVGVLCYTSPLAFSLGGSKATNTVFKSWCRMVGSQLLLLVMNVWFLRGFASSMGQFIANGGALSTGKGSLFLWLFCALAYLKCAQRFDSYLGSIGMNVAQTGSSMGMELMMAARVLTGVGGGAKTAGNVFGRGGSVATGTGAAANGFAAGFASRFNPNSYVRDAVVDGGTRMGFGGGAGFVARAFGGMAARNGATLNGDSISSVASRSPSNSGMIAGDIADRSLGNYIPQMQSFQLQGTQISGGHISTTAVSPDGKTSSVDMYSAAQYEKPDAPHSEVTASDGSKWYLIASGEGRGAFYDAPMFNGAPGDMPHTHSAGSPPPMADTDTSTSHTGLEDTPASSSLTHDGTEVHPSMATFPDVSEEAGGGYSAAEGTVLANDGIDSHPSVIPFPGSAEEHTPTDGSTQDGTILTGDSADVPPGMTAFPVAGEHSSDTDLHADGVASTIVADTLDTSGSTPQLGDTPGDYSQEPAADTGSPISGTADETPMGSTFADFQHFDRGVGGGFGDSPYIGGFHETVEDSSEGFHESGTQNTYSEAPLVAATFPNAPEGTALRTVDEGVIEASSPDGGNTLWYNSAFYQEPDAPHTVMQAANGVGWYAMQQQADMPYFEADNAAGAYNQAAFRSFMPGYELPVSKVDGTHRQEGHFEVRHEDGSGTRFYDTARYAVPRGDYQIYADTRGSQWYAIRGEAAVDRKPIFENGQPVYDDGKLRTVNVETVRYRQTPARFAEPEKRSDIDRKTPRRKM